MQEAHKEEMKANLSGFLGQSPSFSGKSVMIFGHCNPAEEMAEYLLEMSVPILCYLDNNQEKQGTLMGDIPVHSPNYITNHKKEDSIVLVVSRYYETMKQQLRKFGYDGEVVEVVEYDTFSSFSTEDEVFQAKKQRVLDGFSVLQEIKSQFPGFFLILCPNQALGDVYWAMTYLKAYQKKEKIQSCAIILVGNGCETVAKLFGYDKITVLTQKKMDALVQALVFSGEKDALIAQHNHYYGDLSFQVLREKFIHFSDFYRDIIYKLPKNTTPTPITHTESLENPEIIPQGKSIIFAPYANSIVEAPTSFWETLAEEYQNQGFQVFTNVLPEQEPISGTEPLVLPLLQMIPAVERAGHFVGLRSGLCDIIHSAKCKKTLVFPDCYYSFTPHKVADFFSLDGWEQIILP